MQGNGTYRTGIYNYVNAPKGLEDVVLKPRTVSGRVGARTAGRFDNRATWAPTRVDSNQTLQNMQSTRNMMRCQLGVDFRINEDLTAAIPIHVLPYSLQQATRTPRVIDQTKER
jgi:head-tail adaptor